MNADLVLADDATGALECASLLAGLGLAVAIAFGGPRGAPGLLVVDTETRHLSAEAAGAVVRRWAVAGLFKKTDSTLRGNIAAELLALPGPVVYLPAYPALGRTVREGRLFVDGVPVHETDFARDGRHPVTSSSIAALFPAGTTRLVPEPSALSLDDERVQICDAETDADLVRFTEVLAGRRVTLAGPGGIVKLWAGLRDFPRAVARVRPKIRTWLVVCGSLHPQSRRQAEAAHGMTVLATPAGFGSPEREAGELALRAVEWIGRHEPEGVLIMGGDTAIALWRALGIDTLEPLPEVLPGIAACFGQGRLFVTKAGGFGSEDLVQQVRERFI